MWRKNLLIHNIDLTGHKYPKQVSHRSALALEVQDFF